MFFALTEVVLYMFDGWLGNAKRYWIPLLVSASAFIAYFVLIMWIVAQIEASYVARAFPIISLIAAVVLGCARWHKRSMVQPITRKAKSAQSKPEPAQPESEPMRSQVAQAHNEVVQDVQSDLAQEPEDSTTDKRIRATQLRSEGLSYAQIASELDVHRNTIANWLKSTNGHKQEAA
jgi:hypothetical protein